MNAYYFFKRFVKTISKIHLPRAYVCDPKTYFGLGRKKDFYSLFQHYLKNSKSNYNVNELSFLINRTDTSYLKLMAIPISFFVLEMFKTNLSCEEESEVKQSKPYLGCFIRYKPEEGMQIVMVKSDSVAEKSGLKVKDIIIAIDDKPIRSINEYLAALGQGRTRRVFKIKSWDEALSNYTFREIQVNFE